MLHHFLHRLNSLAEFMRLLLPKREHLPYAPPLAVAAVDHGMSWVTVVGLTIGVGGFINHSIQTYIRWVEHKAKERGARP